jgi:long-chain acyl-CoA synthetase
VVPEFEVLKAWAATHGLESMSNQALCDHSAVNNLIGRELVERTVEFKSHEAPKRFAIVSEEFTTGNGMLTPTLKLKRQVILTTYAERLAALYDSP